MPEANLFVGIIAFIIYAIGMVYIGAYYSKKQKTEADYLAGNHAIGGNMVGISGISLKVSGSTFLGYSAMGYTFGLSGYWITWPLWFGTWLWARYGAPRMRQKGKFTTLPEYLEHEYGGKFARKFSSIIVIIRDIGWVATGMVGFGTIGNYLLGVEYWLAALIGLFITILYVVLGGYMAATVTNFIQALLVFAGGLWLVVGGITKLGGISGFSESLLQEFPKAFSASNVPLKQVVAWIMIYTFFNWVIQSVILKSSFTAVDPKGAMKGSAINTLLTVFFYLLPFLIGMIARAAFGADIKSGNSYIGTLMWVGGSIGGPLLLVPFAAAVMSTSDLALLSASSNLMLDWIAPAKAAKNEAQTEKQRVLLSRVSVVGLAIISYVVALLLPLVLELAILGIKFATVMAPAILGTIFWKRSKGCTRAYTWSLVLGFFTMLIVQIIQQSSAKLVGATFVYSVDPVVIVLPLCFVFYIVAVLLDKPNSEYLKKHIGEVEQNMI